MLHFLQHNKNADFFAEKQKKVYLWLRKSEVKNYLMKSVMHKTREAQPQPNGV